MAKTGAALACALTAVHVAVFAQLGTLTREYLDKLFQDGCSGGWGLCLTSSGARAKSYGAYFTDIPSNMLGCLIMGCLATSASLGLAGRKAAGILPASHPWQANAPLMAGLRTGFCGSLTTFSAWQLQELLLLVGGTGRDGGQWAQALWAVVIGLQTSLASLVTGQHAALAVHRWLLKEGRAAMVPDGAHPTSVAAGFRGRGALLLASQPSPADRLTNDSLRRRFGSPTAATGGIAAAPAATAAVTAGYLANRQAALPYDDAPAATDLPLTGPGSSVAGAAVSDQDLETERNQEAAQQVLNGGSASSATNGPGADEEAATEGKAKAVFRAHGDARWHAGRKTHAAAALLLVLLTALFVTLTVVDTGQFGALLRWQLAGLNGRLPGRCAWFPAGTFAANLLACVIIFAAQIPGDVGTLGYWPRIVVLAVQKGFCGALSTVSTFVNEIHVMFDVHPDHFHAYTYILISFGAAWLAGLAVYGAPAWAHM